MILLAEYTFQSITYTTSHTMSKKVNYVPVGKNIRPSYLSLDKWRPLTYGIEFMRKGQQRSIWRADIEAEVYSCFLALSLQR